MKRLHWASQPPGKCAALVFALGIALLLLNGCNGFPNANPGLPFMYADFGPESFASPLLGPKGRDTQVIARFGSTQVSPPPGSPDVRYVSIPQAMNFLRFSVRKLPKTAENALLHQRLKHTYERMYRQYNLKRTAFLSAPSSSYGRGGMNRALMMPPMPPTI